MKIFFISITAFILLSYPALFHAQTAKKKSVAVLEFQKSGGVSLDDAVTLSNRFRGLLVETKAFEVVEREKMNDLLKAQDFNMSDACNTSECAVQVGQLLGVQAMIAGDIGKVGQTYTIDLRLIDVETGKIIDTKRQNHKGEVDGLLDAMAVIAQGFASPQGSAQAQVFGKQVADGRGQTAAKQKEEAAKIAASKKTSVLPEPISVPYLITVTSVPSDNWHGMSVLSSKNHLKSTFNSSSFTSYQGVVALKTVPVVVGANIQFDNNVIGSIQRFAGFISYKRKTMLKIESGSIKGEARWTGTLLPPLPQSFAFRNEYTNVDFVFPFDKNAISFIGVGYGAVASPVQLKILKGIKNHGTSVYDPDFKMKTFSLVANVESVPMEFSSSGFGVFASMGYRFGLAVGTTSKKADALAEAMNPGAKSNGRDSYHMNLEYNLGLGPRYGFSIGKAKVFVAAGYEIASIFMFEEGLSLNTSETKFVYEPIYKFFRSGLIFKTYVGF